MSLARRSPLRSRSAKTAARDRRYRIEREEFLEQHPICEAMHEGCRFIATEVHHKAGRAPSVFFRHELWLAVCWTCHVWITNHPAEAIARGWSVRRIGIEVGG